MDERLRAADRVRKRRTYQALFKKGTFRRGKILKIWVWTDPEAANERAKLGVIVGRRESALAVIRNLWKRRIREAFRRHRASIRDGRLVVIQARAQKKVPAYSEIATEIIKILGETTSLK